MVDFCYKRALVNVREISFGSLKDVDGNDFYDVLYMHSCDESSSYNGKKLCVIESQTTLVTDLTLEKEQIFNKLKKNCRYEVRRAEREGASVLFYYQEGQEEIIQIIDEFEKTYNAMFISKGLKNRFNRSLIESALRSHQLLLSTCKVESSQSKVFHAYLIDKSGAILIYSTSSLWDEDDKDTHKLIGYMNKHLHWKDMIWLKEKGYERYEWGGIAKDGKNQGIVSFKREFGGYEKEYLNYIISNSLMGNIYIILLKLRRRDG